MHGVEQEISLQRLQAPPDRLKEGKKMHIHYKNGPEIVRRARQQDKRWNEYRYIKILEIITLAMCSVVIFQAAILVWKCL